MKDIVSIKKIRPLALAEADEGTGAALNCGDDFFLGGNEPSLAVQELFTTGDTGRHRGKHERSLRKRGNPRMIWRLRCLTRRVLNPECSMLPFKLVYSDDYYLPIGSHVFPSEKYRCIHDRLLASGIAEPSDFVAPPPAADEDILLVHTPQYVHKLKTGTLTALEELELEVPYSPEL